MEREIPYLGPEIEMFLKEVHFLEAVWLIAEIGKPIHEPSLTVMTINTMDQRKQQEHPPNLGIHSLETNCEAEYSISIFWCFPCPSKRKHEMLDNV